MTAELSYLASPALAAALAGAALLGAPQRREPDRLGVSRGVSVSSTPIYVEASGQDTLDADTALPFVVTIPVLLGAAAATVRWRFRRTG